MSVKNKSNPTTEQGRQQPDINQVVAYPYTRGYQKLANAAQSLGIDFRGLTVLDIGSSTGGFTSYALEHGAKQVIAIEKGTNQMAAPLRFDSRIELHEKTDIFNVYCQAKQPEIEADDQDANMILIPTPDLILADISFLSLTTVLSYARNHLASSQTRFLVMLKPQFEASPSELRNGVIKNSKIRRNIIKNFEIKLKQQGFHIIKKLDNQLAGRSGNLERFYYLSLEK